MAINRPRIRRDIDFAIVAISLVVIGTALGCLTYITADHAGRMDDPEVRRVLTHLAWTSLVLLGGVVVLFVWLVVRQVSRRLRRHRGPEGPTPHLDAWTLAGQRFKLSPEDEAALANLEVEEPPSQDKDDTDAPDDDQDEEPPPDRGPAWR